MVRWSTPRDNRPVRLPRLGHGSQAREKKGLGFAQGLYLAIAAGLVVWLLAAAVVWLVLS